ncbi:MAG: HAD-IB family phosphatase [Halobacteriota archaeon]|nr:HAD-IB family phosphatase [Halobacteriota archaeon]
MKLLVFDMDNTLLDGRVIVALSEELGFERKLSDILDRFRKGDILGYEVSDYLASLLKGLTPEELIDIVNKIPLSEGIQPVAAELKKRYKIAIVSDSYTIAANLIKEKIGADLVLANILEIENGKLTGKILNLYNWSYNRPNCRKHSICKFEALKMMANSIGLSPEDSIFVGDGPPDACAMQIAGKGIGFNASPEVREAADVIIEDMFQLLDKL